MNEKKGENETDKESLRKGNYISTPSTSQNGFSSCVALKIL